VTTNREAASKATIREALDSALLADRSARLRQIDAAITAEPDDGRRGSLFLDRAIAQQGAADPSRPAADGVRAFELLVGSGRNDEAAFAAAVAGGMMQRAGDVEAAVDYGVEAMALIDVADRTLVAGRAANAISVLFGQLSAFEQAFAYSNLAADICEHNLESAPVAACYNACYVAVEAWHAGVHLPFDRARQAITQLMNDPNQIASVMLGSGMAAELAFIEHPDLFDTVDLDDTEIEDAAPRLQAWYRLVLAVRAHGTGDNAKAVELLDVALPALIAVGDDHRVVRAYRLRSKARAALGDMTGALEDSDAVGQTVRGWQVDQVGRLAVQISRRAELEQMQTSMQRRAVDLVRQINVDELTRTGSRRLLEVRLDELEHETGSVSIALVDIDEFKSVNDEHGHAAGDAVLKRVGHALSTTRQPCVLLARYGGDEFVAVFSESGTTTAAAFTDEVRATLAETDWASISPGLDVHVSAGVATGPSATARSVIEHADTALYSAKRQGRNRTVIAS